VIPLSHSEESKNQVLSKLLGDNSSSEFDVNKSTFKVIDVDRGVLAVIVQPNFLAEVNTENGKMKLIEGLLKLFYVYCKKEDVAKSSLFATYVSMLSKQTSFN
jgi:hypothetical protein